MAERIKPMTSLTSSMPVVCHVTTVHGPFDTRIFHKECRSLVEAGYEVHLVACHDRDEMVGGVHLHALPRPRGRIRRMLFGPWRAFRKVRAIRPRPVLCHFHDPEFLLAGALLRRCGIQVVYDVHENVADLIRHKTYLPAPLRPVLAWIYRAVEWMLLRSVATVHVLESIAVRYPEPRAVVQNFPRLDEPAPPRSRPAGCPRLLYVGDLNRERGAMTMIALAQALRRRGLDFEMRLVGPVREAGLELAMREAIREGDLAHHVVLAGPVSYERVAREIAEADIGLCLLDPKPNYLNSLPVKVLEYMRGGLAVVASDFACWRPLLADTGAGVQVDSGNVEAVADVIAGLLADPERRRAMGRLGQQAVKERYHWQTEADRLIDLYRRLLEGRDRP